MTTLTAAPHDPQQPRIPEHGCTYTYESADGWALGYEIELSDGGPGLRGGLPDVGRIEGPWLVDEDAWRLAHPTVDPTPAALQAAYDREYDRILEDVEDHVAEPDLPYPEFDIPGEDY